MYIIIIFWICLVIGYLFQFAHETIVTMHKNVKYDLLFFLELKAYIYKVNPVTKMIQCFSYTKHIEIK